MAQPLHHSWPFDLSESLQKITLSIIQLGPRSSSKWFLRWRFSDWSKYFTRSIDYQKRNVTTINRKRIPSTKWASNDPALLDDQASCSQKEFILSSDKECESRTLGLVWDCNCDHFKFSSILNLPPLVTPTKRSIQEYPWSLTLSDFLDQPRLLLKWSCKTCGALKWVGMNHCL